MPGFGWFALGAFFLLIGACLLFIYAAVKSVKEQYGSLSRFELKVGPEDFQNIQWGRKNFEFALGDSKVAEGDILVIKEFSKGSFTGRELEKFAGTVITIYFNVPGGLAAIRWPAEEVNKKGLKIISII